MDFRKRLQMATERGERARAVEQQQAAAAAITEEEYKRIHSQHRLELTEHIERCLEQLGDNFPGFRYETVVDERGWGGAVSRDDLQIEKGRRRNAYSRLQLLVGPFGKHHVLAIDAKGTVKNKENFNRQHFQKLDEIDTDDFCQLVERWVLDYAEAYAAA